MTDNDSSNKSSDAWLLLALMYGREASDRRQILSIGDSINHALFTDEELEGGLQRLIAGGHVQELGGGVYRPAPGVLAWFDGASPARSRVHKDLERLEKYLEGK